METTSQQLEETLGKVIDKKIDNLVTREEFSQFRGEVREEFSQFRGELAQFRNEVADGFDKTLGKFSDLEQEYIFIKDWIIKHEKKEKEMQSIIDDLQKRVVELEKKAA